MNIREKIEEREYEILSPCAAHARESLGRFSEEPECDIRTVYQRDRDRIVHSESFRRLKNKTQVFFIPAGDYYRTRLTHTLEVSQIGRTIAKALSLNEDLVDAISLGHDLGHPPYGHAGERILNELLMRDTGNGFHHHLQSVRQVQFLERDGRGLNLTKEVLDGIENHGTASMPFTLEGKVVRLSDKIAYIHHDGDDAIHAGILEESDIPGEIQKTLGKTVKERLNRLIHDVITTSYGQNDIIQSAEIGEAMMELRKFMFDRVYQSELVIAEEKKVHNMIRELYEYYLTHTEKIPETYLKFLRNGEKKEIVVCDYISGMTDSYAVRRYEQLFVPVGWHD